MPCFGVKKLCRDCGKTAHSSCQASKVEAELVSLHEGSLARYQIRPSEFDAWQQVWTEGKKSE
jgi:hypothetical protein